MGSRTKIDWCDTTWNPVTGCLHGCEYCYARKIATRFGGYEAENKLHEFDKRQVIKLRNDDGEWNPWQKNPYPYGFDPTFHRYRLDEPQKWKKPRNIFVSSMGDLFGDWVPDEWIAEVFKACEASPQHRYLFLTKNPKRYVDLYRKGIMRVADNFWYGSTVTDGDTMFYYSMMPDENPKTFVSIEPILKPFGEFLICDTADWIIVGAETGNRKGKVVPKKEWIMDVAKACEMDKVPLFMKESLRGLMGDDFIQDFPWEVRK